MVGGGGGWYEVTTRDKVSKMTLPIMGNKDSPAVTTMLRVRIFVLLQEKL